MHTSMISTVLDIFAKTKSIFSQSRTANLFAHHLFANICLTSRKPISQLIHLLGKEDKDWSKHYRLYSKHKWDGERLFDSIIQSIPHELKKLPFITINYDETSIPKGGKKIPGVSLLRDPHSPKFRANFKLGLRCGQASIQLPLNNNHPIARSVPIDFKICPVLKKPSRKASEEEINAYKTLSKERTLSKQALERFKFLRQSMNNQGYSNKRILMVLDNAFCNQTVFKSNLVNINVLARARKDTKLCFAAKNGRSNQFFDLHSFCPEDVLKDTTIPWQYRVIRKKGRKIKVKCKEIKGCYWRTGSGRKPLRLIVIAALRYWKNNKWNHTDPAFLLTDDLEATLKELIQAYNNRWQIEINHWDEKDVFGLGDAQVRSPKSVERQLRSVVFAYSVVLVAGRKHEVGRQGTFMEGMGRSKWYSERPRWSLRDMMRQIRYEVWNFPQITESIGLKLNLIKPLIYNAY